MAGVEQGEWQPEPAISHGWPFTLQLGTVGLGEHLKQSTCKWQIVVRLFAAAGLHAAAHLAAATSHCQGHNAQHSNNSTTHPHDLLIRLACT